MKKQLFTLLLLLGCMSVGWAQNRRVDFAYPNK